MHVFKESANFITDISYNMCMKIKIVFEEVSTYRVIQLYQLLLICNMIISSHVLGCVVMSRRGQQSISKVLHGAVDQRKCLQSIPGDMHMIFSNYYSGASFININIRK